MDKTTIFMDNPTHIILLFFSAFLPYLDGLVVLVVVTGLGRILPLDGSLIVQVHMTVAIGHIE